MQDAQAVKMLKVLFVVLLIMPECSA